MINTKLDSRFENFLADTKGKILELGRELECLEAENYHLEQQISNTFYLNSDLQIQVKSLEEQLQRFNTLHSNNSAEHSVLNEKTTRAKADYERLSMAYKQQVEIMNSEKAAIQEKERVLRQNRHTSEEIFLREYERLEFRAIELKKTKILKSETNAAALNELNASETIEANIITSIHAEMLSLSSITSKSFYKSAQK